MSRIEHQAAEAAEGDASLDEGARLSDWLVAPIRASQRPPPAADASPGAEEPPPGSPGTPAGDAAADAAADAAPACVPPLASAEAAEDVPALPGPVPQPGSGSDPGWVDDEIEPAAGVPRSGPPWRVALLLLLVVLGLAVVLLGVRSIRSNGDGAEDGPGLPAGLEPGSPPSPGDDLPPPPLDHDDDRIGDEAPLPAELEPAARDPRGGRSEPGGAGAAEPESLTGPSVGRFPDLPAEVLRKLDVDGDEAAPPSE